MYRKYLIHAQAYIPSIGTNSMQIFQTGKYLTCQISFRIYKKYISILYQENRILCVCFFFKLLSNKVLEYKTETAK